ncbi:MAG: sugar ABC transporter substrate-binding protein [Eubacteriales bacterium]|nr:sugar ABC transporter substrate-binding protein [Eubacteriales bacterium]
MKLKHRACAMALTGVMLTGLLAGCGSSSDDTTASNNAGSGSGTTASSSDYNIGVILKTTSSEYWQYVKAGAEAYGEEHGISVEVTGPTSETAYDEQQNMIETAVNSGAYDALVIAPLQSDQAATLISGTELPILAVDTDIDAPEVLSFIGTGNEEAAAQGGAAAVEAAKEAGWEEIKAIEICGVQGDATNTARYEGYKKGITEAGGEFLEDETQYADAVADKAVTSMEAIMQTHPEGVAIICANNDDMAMAAARAAEGNEAYANTIFVGFDGNRAACESILAGEETMSVSQDAYGMGYKSVEAAVAALNGETIEEFIDSGSDVITADNAQERIDTLDGYLK